MKTGNRRDAAWWATVVVGILAVLAFLGYSEFGDFFDHGMPMSKTETSIESQDRRATPEETQEKTRKSDDSDKGVASSTQLDKSQEGEKPDSEPISSNRAESSPTEKKQEWRSEEAYRQEYVHTSMLPQLMGLDEVVVVASGRPGSNNARFASLLRDQGVDAWTGILKQTALRSEVLQQLSSGNEQVFSLLGLAELSGHLVLYDLTVGDFVDTGRLLKTNADLSVRIIPLSGGRVVYREFSARGAGFESSAAEDQAVRRVVDDFLNDSVITSVLGTQ